MADLPKVVSPLATIAEHEGIELLLVSVEVWPDEVVVRMRGRPSPATRTLEAEFGAALDRRHRLGRQGAAPDQPAERLFETDVQVTDDVRTAYTAHSSRGGSGNDAPRHLGIHTRSA